VRRFILPPRRFADGLGKTYEPDPFAQWRPEARRSVRRMIGYPDDHYLILLGKALWAACGVQSIAGEVVRLLDPATTAEAVSGQMMSNSSELLTAKIKRHRGLDLTLKADLGRLASSYAALPELRNDFIHPVPATAPDPAQSQRLYRWAPGKGRAYFIDQAFLEKFLLDVDPVLNGLAAIRERIPRASTGTA
jgi:hypothetical protein